MIFTYNLYRVYLYLELNLFPSLFYSLSPVILKKKHTHRFKVIQQLLSSFNSENYTEPLCFGLNSVHTQSCVWKLWHYSNYFPTMSCALRYRVAYKKITLLFLISLSLKILWYYSPAKDSCSALLCQIVRVIYLCCRIHP